jgi:hypothetical protein
MIVRILGRRRRRRPTMVTAGLVIAGLVTTGLVIAGLAAWWLRRRDDAAHVDGHALDEAAFDETALDRAAGEGMAAAPDPDAGGGIRGPNGAGRVPVAGGGLVRLV